MFTQSLDNSPILTIFTHPMSMKRISLLLFLFLYFNINSFATHLIGGNFVYSWSGGTSYEITMILFRDCNPGNAGMPFSATFRISNASGGFVKSVFALNGGNTILPVSTNDPCLTPPSNICVQQGVFTASTNLSSSAGGYWVSWQSCCRNGTIVNLINPLSQGMTLFMKIPDPGSYAGNSSPVFVNFPPLAICLNQTINFNHSATDVNGDSLSYKLIPSYANTPIAPPFSWVNYASGYSPSYPLASSPALSIDPVTGQLTGTPNLLGQFVVNIGVDEWRNGVKIGQYFREIQFNVANCIQSVSAAIPGIPQANGGPNLIYSCNNYTVNFGNNSTGAISYFWDFGDLTTTTDTSSAEFPSYTYPDTGTYLVSLIANPGFVCADTALAQVILYPTVTPDFSFAGNQCQYSPIQFTDLSTTNFGSIIHWQWYFGDGGSDTVQNPVHTYNGIGNFNTWLIVVTSNGCIDTIVHPVPINLTPQINAGWDATICRGEVSTLSPVGTGSWLWSPGNSLNDSTIKNPDASPLVTTTYTATLTSANGCSRQDSVTIIVLDAPIINAGPDIILCNNSSGQINASAADTSGISSVNWTPSTGLSSTSILNPSVNPQNTTTYVLSVTSNNNCVSTDTITVYRNILSVNAGIDVNICQGNSTQLNATSPNTVSYSWTPTTGLSNPNIQNPIAAPTTNTAYIVTITDAAGCTMNDTVNINVNPLPPVDAGMDVAICIGNNFGLNASGATSYIWDNDPTLSCLNCQSPVASPSATTTYYVTGTDGNACSARDSITITVNPLPTVSITPGDTICVGESTIMTAGGGITYQWSPNNFLTCSTCASTGATPVSTSTYTATVTDINGCINTGNTTIYVNPLPNISITPSTAICSGDSLQLFSNGGIAYQWTPSTGLNNSTISNPMAKPTATTTYTVSVTDANGCINTATTTVTVNANLVISLTPNSDICLGNNIQLNASGGNSYQWTASGSLSCLNCPDPVATPSVNTTYYLTVTDVNGCQNSDSVSITVNPLPNILTGADDTICFGNSTQLSASGGLSYNWAPIAGLINPALPNPVAQPGTTTTYTVTGTDTNGCQNTATQSIIVNQLPPINAGTDAAICIGYNVQMQASGGVSYQWSPLTGLSDPNIANPIANPGTTTSYIVLGTDINGCQNTDTVEVLVNTLPPVTTSPDVAICINNNTQLQASGGVSYSWSPTTNLNNSNIANPVAAPVTTTTYTVLVTDAQGCQNTDSVLVSVNALPVVNVVNDTAICVGDAAQLGANGGVNYLWSPPADLNNPNIANPLASPSVSTIYNVLVTDGNGCQNVNSVSVTVNYPADPQAGTDASICPGGSTQLSASNGVSYNWSPASGLSCTNCPNPIASPGSDQTYTVSIVDINGCLNTGQVTITLFAIPVVSAGFDATIYKGENVQLHGVGGVNYSWSPPTWLDNPNIQDPIATPQDTITYILLVTDANGCQNTDSVTIRIIGLPEAQIPTAFSPNNDGLNDEFKIKWKRNFNLITLMIFNRWGEMVFETSDINQGWDGTVNGNAQPIGTYVYYIKAVDDKGFPYQSSGNLTLIK